MMDYACSKNTKVTDHSTDQYKPAMLNFLPRQNPNGLPTIIFSSSLLYTIFNIWTQCLTTHSINFNESGSKILLLTELVSYPRLWAYDLRVWIHCI